MGTLGFRRRRSKEETNPTRRQLQRKELPPKQSGSLSRLRSWSQRLPSTGGQRAAGSRRDSQTCQGHQPAPLASVENPLGLPLDEQGQAPSIAVEDLPEEGRQARLEQGTRFREYLNGRDLWIAAFNRLTHFQQVLAVILTDTLNSTPP